MKTEKVVIYARTSGIDIQNSLLAQVNSCEQYCKQNGMQVSSIIEVEGDTDRSFPELLKIIHNSKEKLTIVVKTIDRISGNDSDCRLLKGLEAGGKLEIKEACGIANKKLSKTKEEANEVFFSLTSLEFNEIAEDELDRELTKEEMYKVEHELVVDGSWSEFINDKVKGKIMDLYAEDENK